MEEVPAAIAPFQGRVLIGVGKLLRVYDLGKKKLLRKCENKVLAACSCCSLGVSDVLQQELNKEFSCYSSPSVSVHLDFRAVSVPCWCVLGVCVQSSSGCRGAAHLFPIAIQKLQVPFCASSMPAVNEHVQACETPTQTVPLAICCKC